MRRFEPRGAGQLPSGLSGSFDHNQDAFTLNPAFVETETSVPRSLLDKALAGDADAFCEICRAYETRLLRQAMVLCGNESLAEDLAQDTLVEAWKCLRRFNGRCQFFTWLCAILLNRHRNTVRQKRPMALSSLGGPDRDEFENSLDHLADPEALPDQAAELREQAALVFACIQALPPKQQRVIYLRFYVDHSLEGIAAALGCSVGTVKSRLFNALERLRRMNALATAPRHVKIKEACL